MFPKLTFVERIYARDPTNWWFPNYAGLGALVRAAGMEILARPRIDVVVAEPKVRLGSVRRRRLVFPRYARPGYAALPAKIRHLPHEWQELLDSRTERLEDG